jgi:sugar-specific transcriptional regulator TrmB
MDTTILEQLGLSKKAATIYLAALSLGIASVQDIANKTKMKRPTAYLHIQDLLDQALVEKVLVGKKVYYKATDPQLLHQRAEQNLAAIKEALPELEALKATTVGRPQVRFLEGEKALREIHKDIAQANTIRFIADLQSFESLFADSFNLLSSAIQENQIRTREIIPDTPAARRSSKRYAAIAGKYYSSRIATSGPIYNDTAIYNDTVVLFRIHEQTPYVVVIQDATIAATMATVFDMAWKSAEPFIPRS